MAKLTYIDLFAGCGGLSLGLKRAGFELALAVEKSDMAAETFYHNFIERIRDKETWKKFCAMPVSKQAEKKLIVNAVSELLADRSLLNKLKKQDIAVVAGGPPCQGFSLAGRRDPNDIRNKLCWEFLDVVEAVQPRAVIIENVVGMSRDFVKHEREAPFDQVKKALERIKPGYVVQQVIFNTMHFGVPQHRPRVLILAIRRDLAKDIQFYEGIWHSDYDQDDELRKIRPDIAPVAKYFGRGIQTVRDAIWDLGNEGYRFPLNHKRYLDSEGDLVRNLRRDQSWMPKNIGTSTKQSALQNHVLRKHSEQIIRRFRLYHVIRDYNLPVKILSIPKQHRSDKAKEILKDVLKPYESQAYIAADKTVLAKNKADLINLIMELGTKKHSQRPLKWSEPSPTVVSLPDDFVHPHEPRTLTVRELARFQSFPDSFIFRAKETTGSHRRRFEVPQYTQVGNAVPPIMAEAVGKQLKKILCGELKNKKTTGKQKISTYA